MRTGRRRSGIGSFHALRLRNVTKIIDGTTVLQDVALDVRRGQVVGLLGSNGAGKTTLFRVLLGLASLDSGEALIGRRPFRKLKEPLRSVGAVLDNSTLDPRLSARANLRVYASAYHVSHERIDDLLRLVGLVEVQSKPISSYSLGMKKRLSIAVCLLTDPTFIVLDEPSNGLDPAGLEWLKRLLVDLAKEQDKGILLSSHMLADIESILDMVVVLHAGKILYTGSVDDLRGVGVTRVLAADERTLGGALRRGGLSVRATCPGSLEVDGDVRAEVGRIALASAIPLQGLEFRRDSLTAAYFRILQLQDPSIAL